MDTGFGTLRARRALRLASVAALIAAAGGTRAWAVTGFAIDRFEPAGASSEWMSLESLDFSGHLRSAFALTGDWAGKPLVFYDPSGHAIAPLVSHQLMGHADAALLLWERARVDVNVPIAMAQGGSDADIRGQSYSSPQGGGIGDLRLGVDAWVFRSARAHLTVAAGAQLFLPTGQTQDFSSDGGVRFWPRAMVAGERGRITWAARLGLQFRPHDGCNCDLAPGTEVNAGAGVGWRISPRLLAATELYGSRALSSSGAFAHASPPLEILLAGHVVVAPRWTASFGLAPGLTDGAGSPVVRAVIGVQYALPAPAPPAPPPPPASSELIP